MTNNQTKAVEFLNKIRTIEKSINEKELEIEALRYKASGAGAIRYDKDRVQTSPQNFLEMAMCDIIKLEDEIEADKLSIDQIKMDAYEIVKRMLDTSQRTIIDWFYLNGLDMENIAQRMYISERAAYYLRDYALESFGMLMP